MFAKRAHLPAFGLQFTPSREGYLRFLAESKAVYDVLEKVVQDAPKPECKRCLAFMIACCRALGWSVP